MDEIDTCIKAVFQYKGVCKRGSGMKFLVTLRIPEIFRCIVATLTLYGMGGGGIHPPWRFFLHCAKTFGTRELKLFDF